MTTKTSLTATEIATQHQNGSLRDIDLLGEVLSLAVSTGKTFGALFAEIVPANPDFFDSFFVQGFESVVAEFCPNGWPTERSQQIRADRKMSYFLRLHELGRDTEWKSLTRSYLRGL